MPRNLERRSFALNHHHLIEPATKGKVIVNAFAVDVADTLDLAVSKRRGGDCHAMNTKARISQVLAANIACATTSGFVIQSASGTIRRLCPGGGTVQNVQARTGRIAFVAPAGQSVTLGTPNAASPVERIASVLGLPSMTKNARFAFHILPSAPGGTSSALPHSP